MTLQITGRVFDLRTGRGLSELSVEVWRGENVMARSSSPTDAQGDFEIVLDETVFRDVSGQITLTLKVFQADGAELRVAEGSTVEWEPGQELIEAGLAVAQPLTKAPEEIAHEFVGQLLHAQTSAPLAGLTVRGFDKKARPDSKHLGYDITDERGMFGLVYRAPATGDNDASTRTLEFHILDSEGEKIHTVDIEAEIDQRYVEQFRVPIPPAPEPASPGLAQVAEATGLEVPSELLPHLAEEQIPEAGVHGIHTLADIRRAGGIAQLPGLPVPADHPAVRELDAHADLDRVSSLLQVKEDTGLAVNSALIRGGYTSVGAVAEAPRTNIVHMGSDLLGDVKAAQMHVVAKAQTQVLHNAVATIQTSWANGQVATIDGTTAAPAIPAAAPTCGCADCQAAVSPLAYLADLLHYSLKHLKKSRPVEGLKGYYYDNIDLTNLKLIRTDPTIDFAWVKGQSPAPSLDEETFSVRWMGYVTPRHSETYTFYTTSDDGVRLWVDGRLLIDNWTDHPPKEDMGTIALIADRKYVIRLEFYEHGVAARIALEWSSASQPREIIPSSRLSSTADESIDLPFLHSTFHQRFADLPASCQALEQEVRQVRLCIEVLRSYMRAEHVPILPKQQEKLAKDEAAYRHAAYQMLLARIGTSYDELRRTRRGGEQAQAALAGRLGIKPDHLGELFLEPQSITELKLQELFGLADTTRADVLADIKTPLLEQWRLEGLRARWEQEDWPSDPYDARLPDDEQLPWIDPDLIEPDDFRHPVPKGSPRMPDFPFDVWLKRRRWVDARLHELAQLVEHDGSPDWKATLGFMQDKIPSWATVSWASLVALRDALGQGTASQERRDELRNLGLTVESLARLIALRDQNLQNRVISPAGLREVAAILVQAEKVTLFPDWLVEEQALPFRLEAAWIAQHEPRQGEWPPARLLDRPQIDPERIQPEDVPDGIDRKVVLRLWQLRRTLLDQIRMALQETRETTKKTEAEPHKDFDQMVRLALGHPNPGDPLLHNLDALKADLDGGGAAAEQAEQKITHNLYLTVDGFRHLMQVKTAPAPAPAVWAKLYGLLTTAQKLKREYPQWAAEEQQLPLIDPEMLKLADLPDTVVGAHAIELWKGRVKELEGERKRLKERREGSGFDAMLREALRDPETGAPLPQSPDLAKLSAELKSGEKRAREATLQVTRDLFMTIADFERLVVIKAKADQLDRLKKPTAAEWAEAYAILAGVQKQKGRYPAWRGQEQADSVVYWTALKARLARWRASTAARQIWQQAVRAHHAAPIVDPDLIGLEHIDRAHQALVQLWGDRWKDLDTTLKTLVDGRSGTADKRQWFSNAALQATGVMADDLFLLDAEREQGANISARLEQLYLDRNTLVYLVRIAKALAGNQKVLDSEWEDVDSILVQIYKRKQFISWRAAEQQLKLTLSPDFFKIPPLDTSTFPPPQPRELPAWRATSASLQAWQDKLQARIDQRQALIAGLRAAVSATEEATLPMLRDALLAVIGPPDNTLADNAKWFTDRFLIDASADGCQKTTRMVQAIETLQGILWSLRTRQLNDTYPDLELDADDFDEEWQWLGSYGTWRAAMLVFLYPENILLPTLRRWKTPAFRELMSNVRADSALTPDSACKAAREYYTYLHDVCSLQLEASCEASARASDENPCRDGAGLSYDYPMFLFARSTVTNKAYWSVVYNPSDPKNSTQTLWEAVPKLENVLRILGAVPYTTILKQRYIFLFAQVAEEGKQKLIFITYDLDAMHWGEDRKELNLPGNVSMFTALVVQQIGISRSPQLIVRAEDGTIYDNYLSSDGSQLAQANWNLMIDRSQGQDRELLSAIVQDASHYYLFVRNRRTGFLEFRIYDANNDASWHRMAASGSWLWNGAMQVSGGITNKVFAFWTEGGITMVQQPTLTSQLPFVTINTIEQFNTWLTASSVLADSSVALYNLQKLSLARYTPPDPISRDAISADLTNVFHLLTLPIANPTRQALGVARYQQLALDITEWLWEHIYHPTNPQRKDMDPEIAKALNGIDIFLEQYNKDRNWQLNDILYKLFLPSRSYQFRDLSSVRKKALSYSLAGLQTIVTACSEHVRAIDVRDIALQRAAGRVGLWLGRCTIDGQIKEVVQRVAPSIMGSFGLPQQLSEAELQARRLEIKAVFETNTGGTNTNTVYQQEAFYFVPVHIALQLQQRGYYMEALDWFRAVYDYSMPRSPSDQRKIYYGLALEESVSTGYKRLDDWLQDPLNPHAIAATRRNTYTRFTLLSLVRCLLDYADAEFTRDTAESLPRARTLYLTALELLNQPELRQQLDLCESLIGRLEITIDDPRTQAEWEQVKQEFGEIADYSVLFDAVESAKMILAAGGDPKDQFAGIRAVIQGAKGRTRERDTIGDTLTWQEDHTRQAHMALLAPPTVAEATRQAGAAAGKTFLGDVSAVSGIGVAALTTDRTELPWLRERSSADGLPDSSGASRRVSGTWFSQSGGGHGSSPSHTGTSTGNTQGDRFIDGLRALKVRRKENEKPAYVPNRTYGFCVPPNPVTRALRLRAELNLYKLRTCRNIAGMRRQVQAYAAPPDTISGLPAISMGGQLALPDATRLQPTPYRYTVLIERAKRLAELAQQMEGAFLNALEKLDAERYNLLKARQDMNLAQAEVDLQKQRVIEAKSNVTLTQLKQQRAVIQRDHYQGLLQQGFSDYEKRSLRLLEWAAKFQYGAAFVSGLVGIGAAIAAAAAGAAVGGTAGAAAGGPPGAAAGGTTGAGAATILAMAAPGIASSVASGLSSFAQGLSTDASILATLANYERRAQEWSLLYDVANQDILIGDTDIRNANDRARVVEQERTIAEMKTAHAREMIDFLTTKFTNAELYDWMSGVLERVYSFFLQQAISTARLAADQMAFERHEVPPALIQADYWETPSKGDITNSANGKTPDRRGLTGSARLLQDIYQLDQYAFGTARRRHQLSRTLSLMRLAPYEFQRFRETGVIIFATPMDLFDRDFPGHYMRLIKRVRVSVVALIPPIEGIRATLLNGGLSRVVIGPDVFQTVVVRREPESITLSSPMSATGLFELEQQPELSLPFEHIGVDTTWELRMPRASNSFDYRSIADVFMTIEYTALDSYDYRQQVIQRLDRAISAERPFSFRHELPDQWYDLHNPELLGEAQQMVVTFRTAREDFPPNVEGLKIQHVVLYIARKNGSSFEIPLVSLRFGEHGNSEMAGGEATPNEEGVVSTRASIMSDSNAGSWTPIIGKSPIGIWELDLRNTKDMPGRFKKGEIEDILLVITYSGQTPEWPA